VSCVTLTEGTDMWLDAIVWPSCCEGRSRREKENPVSYPACAFLSFALNPPGEEVMSYCKFLAKVGGSNHESEKT
jgi:hypothetical protein